jgi:beta-lactamase superfamily II metal-dependent hydrolase
LVLKISYGATSALMEGDAEALSEQRMLGRNPSAGLLNVGHHGSKTSATPEFLAAVRPQFAVISVGTRNPFGLPKVDVLERLEGVSTYRTDMNGASTFFLDGRTVTQIPRHPECESFPRFESGRKDIKHSESDDKSWVPLRRSDVRRQAFLARKPK